MLPGFEFSFALGLVVVLVALAAASIRILREYERGVIFFLGRFHGIKGPGLIVVTPGSTRGRLRMEAHDAGSSPA